MAEEQSTCSVTSWGALTAAVKHKTEFTWRLEYFNELVTIKSNHLTGSKTVETVPLAVCEFEEKVDLETYQAKKSLPMKLKIDYNYKGIGKRHDIAMFAGLYDKRDTVVASEVGVFIKVSLIKDNEVVHEADWGGVDLMKVAGWGSPCFMYADTIAKYLDSQGGFTIRFNFDHLVYRPAAPIFLGYEREKLEKTRELDNSV